MVAWYWLILAYVIGVATPVTILIADFMSAVNNLSVSASSPYRPWVLFAAGALSVCAVLGLAWLVWLIVQVVAFFLLG